MNFLWSRRAVSALITGTRIHPGGWQLRILRLTGCRTWRARRRTVSRAHAPGPRSAVSAAVPAATHPQLLQEHTMTVSSQPARPSGGLADKWKVLISTVFGIFMIVLDSTVINVAFQTLRGEFQASLTAAQWIISIYVLSLGISTPLAGFLADRFG